MNRTARNENLAISASAGSGKTFQLAHRVIGLMARGVPPDRICALTFSRKAAGEIFDGIVDYLCRASVSAAEAEATARRIHYRACDSKTFLSLLRVLLTNLNRLHIGTLDSFIIGIVRAFPIELGVTMDFTVLDEGGPEAMDLRREVLGDTLGGGGRNKAARQLFEAFKQATFGQEEKTVGDRLDTFIGENRFRYQMLPDEAAWGQAEVIWPGGCEWIQPVKGLGTSADGLRRSLQAQGLPADALKRWEAFIEAVKSFTAGGPWTPPIEYFFSRLAGQADALSNGSGAVKIGRKTHDLQPDQIAPALKLIRHIMHEELKAALQRTQGVFRVLDQFEQLYDAHMRRSGHLTFSDAQYLLTESNRCSGGALLSRMINEEGRLYIDYRLDAQLDHWLLDEFQDTSDLQWAVLRNLIDETVQDDSGDRSFFYVGDIKQAIYGWRGGNARLFDRVLRDYGGRIEQQHLATSFRSSPPVIEVVNEVFSNLEHPELPTGAVERWRGTWQPHRCEPGKVPSEGYAAVIEPRAAPGEPKPDASDRYHAVACLLREIQPTDAGLSVAVLVRTNSAGKSVVDYLRRECPGLSPTHEGPAFIIDNPVTAVLLSLVRFAAHPGNTLAWRHLEMSPLGRVFKKHRLTQEDLPLLLLREIHTSGFQSVVRCWGRRLDEVAGLDSFGRMRMADLCNAATEFDVLGTREPAAFLRFVEGYQIKDISTGTGVRVMTIHQSKGLGFDVVILPDLMDSRSMASAGLLGFVTARDDRTDRPPWTLKMPRREVAEVDPVLADVLRVEDEDSCMDDLCVLYVAMTRAKRALYFVTSYPGPSSQSVTMGAFVKARLVGDAKPTDGPVCELGGETFTLLHECGQRDWFRRLAARPASEIGPASLRTPPAGFSDRRSARKRLMLVEPSTQEPVVRPAAALFARENRDVLDFGSAIHHLFEQIIWIEDVDVEKILQDWREVAAVSPDVERDVSLQFRRAVKSPEVRHALSRPKGQVDLWREKRFEIVLEKGEWVSGAFDRVAILRDGEGRVAGATIFDYKSNRVETDSQIRKTAEGYRPQLSLYGRALSRILAIPRSAITLSLLFTRPGRVFDL